MKIKGGKIFIKRPGNHELIAEQVIALNEHACGGATGYCRRVIRVVSGIQGAAKIIEDRHTSFKPESSGQIIGK